MDSGRSEPDGGQTAVRDVSSGPLASVPLDIAGLLVFLAVAVPFTIGVVSLPEPVQILVGLPLVMLLPGYALTTALFPKRARGELDANVSALGADAIPHRIRGLSDRGLAGAERLAVGFAVSVVLVPLYGLLINYSPLDWSTQSIVGILTAVTVLASIAALVRHRELAAVDTTGYTIAGAVAALRQSLRRSTLDATLTVVVVVCVLFAGVSGAFALTSPLDRTQYTDFNLVTQTDGGEYVEANYPDTLVAGEPADFHVGITNNEQQQTDYTVVVQLQRVRTQDGNVSVLTRNRLASFSTQLDAGETTYAQTSLTPQSLGENFRLAFLLYDESEPPANPTIDNAYRYTFTWVDVVGEETAAASSGSTNSSS